MRRGGGGGFVVPPCLRGGWGRRRWGHHGQVHQLHHHPAAQQRLDGHLARPLRVQEKHEPAHGCKDVEGSEAFGHGVEGRQGSNQVKDVAFQVRLPEVARALLVVVVQRDAGLLHAHGVVHMPEEVGRVDAPVRVAVALFLWGGGGQSVRGG